MGYIYVGGKTNQRINGYGKVGETNQKYLKSFEMVDMLFDISKMPVPAPLASLKDKKARFSDVTEVDKMPEYVLSALSIE